MGGRTGNALAERGELHSTEGLDLVVDTAKAEFSVLDLGSLTIHANSAGHVQQPAAPEKRMSYTFRGGEWQEVGFHSTSPSPTFDIEDVDPAGIDATAGELNMSGAELSHVSVYADARVLSNPSPLPLRGCSRSSPQRPRSTGPAWPPG